MAEPGAILEQLRAARAAHDDARRQTQAARLRQIARRREAQRLARQGDRGAREQVDEAVRDGAAAVADLNAKLESAGRAVIGLVGDLHVAVTPEALTQSWSAETPILLLPLRVETRFKDSRCWSGCFLTKLKSTTMRKFRPERSRRRPGLLVAIATDACNTARKETWRNFVKPLAPRASYA